jgi:hypothetical protein
MGKTILSIVKEGGFRCLPCERVNLDIERFTEYRDSDEHPAEVPFERPELSSSKKKVDESDRRIPTILRYFLDGSRRTYKIADIILDGRYLPLVAGQVGVAVIERDDEGLMKPLREFCSFQNFIAFPDRTNADDLQRLETQINQQNPFQFTMLRYAVKPESDPVDLAVARIMSSMHDLEIATVVQMAERRLLSNDHLLVVDGPLRFRKRFDIVQFRNVVGLSKSFRPSFTVGKGRRREDVGAITSKLDIRERTSVFKTLEEEKLIGMWYLRIRPRLMMSNPLQGIVKLECYAIDHEDRELGLDGDRVDVVSSYIMRERNVTPYKADLRWASHIYPIYMAETYLKSSFMSDIRFQALF